MENANNIIIDHFNIQRNCSKFFPNSTDFDIINYSYTTCFLRIVFVLVARLGFLLIQIGSIPIENVYKIFFYNVFEISNSVIAYSAVGYMLSFGNETLSNIIGYSNNYFNYDLDYLIFGYCSVLLGTAQISSFIIGRIHICSGMLTTLLYSAFFQPMLMHWIWNRKGWMKQWRMMDKNVSVKDHAGTLTVHLSSSVIGLIGAIFLGRRIIKVNELDGQSVGPWNAIGTIIGYIFIMFGYIAYSMPTPQYELDRVPRNHIATTLINNLISCSSGMLTTCLLHIAFCTKYKRQHLNYWSIIRCVQGGIAGLISISTGVDIYFMWYSALLSCFGSILAFFFSFLIQNTFIEDHCNLTATHLVCSLLSSIICPFIAQKENFHVYKNVHTLWQFICISTVLTASVIFATLIFGFFLSIKLLRSKREMKNHNRASALQKYLPKTSFGNRLLAIDDKTNMITPEEHVKRYFEPPEKEIGENVDKNEGKDVENSNDKPRQFESTIETAK